MDSTPQYDIFEILPDGAPIWKCAVANEETAVAELVSMGKGCQNELIAVHLPSSRVVARKPANGNATIVSPDGNGGGERSKNTAA